MQVSFYLSIFSYTYYLHSCEAMSSRLSNFVSETMMSEHQQDFGQVAVASLITGVGRRFTAFGSVRTV